MNNKKKIWVTGSTGMVGQALKRLIISSGTYNIIETKKICYPFLTAILDGKIMTGDICEIERCQSSSIKILPDFYVFTNIEGGQMSNHDSEKDQEEGLWKKLKELVKSISIEWYWVKGHSNDTMNSLADKLARDAIPS